MGMIIVMIKQEEKSNYYTFDQTVVNLQKSNKDCGPI